MTEKKNVNKQEFNFEKVSHWHLPNLTASLCRRVCINMLGKAAVEPLRSSARKGYVLKVWIS